MGAVQGMGYDAAGNVAEWVADDYVTYSLLSTLPCWTRGLVDPLCPHRVGPAKTLRGGGFSSNRATVTTVFREYATTPDAGRGFRCVYGP